MGVNGLLLSQCKEAHFWGGNHGEYTNRHSFARRANDADADMVSHSDGGARIDQAQTDHGGSLSAATAYAPQSGGDSEWRYLRVHLVRADVPARRDSTLVGCGNDGGLPTVRHRCRCRRGCWISAHAGAATSGAPAAFRGQGTTRLRSESGRPSLVNGLPLERFSPLRKTVLNLDEPSGRDAL
jgi:hypothetical protein